MGQDEIEVHDRKKNEYLSSICYMQDVLLSRSLRRVWDLASYPSLTCLGYKGAHLFVRIKRYIGNKGVLRNSTLTDPSANAEMSSGLREKPLGCSFPSVMSVTFPLAVPAYL